MTAPSTPRRLADRGGLGEILAGVISAAQRTTAASAVSVLDCGGGTGSMAVPIAAEGAEVTVVDTSADALATLSRRATEAGVAQRVRGVQGELETLPMHVPGGVFDLVLLHDVLGMVDDPSALLVAAAALTRPGAVVSIQVANPAATVVSRAAAGDLSGAREALRGAADSRPRDIELGRLVELVAAAGLRAERRVGLTAISGWIAAGSPGRPQPELATLDREVAELSPFREIAPALLVLARRPAQ